MNRAVDRAGHGLRLVREEFLLRQPVHEPRQVHLESGQRLSQLVVDLARDARLLLFPHRLQVRGERPQRSLGFPQLFLRQPAVAISSRQFLALDEEIDEHRDLGLEDFRIQRLARCSPRHRPRSL
jgi:hypothetical protein